MVVRTKARIKEWGNSFGIVIPKDVIIRENFKPNQEVVVTITKERGTLEEFFGKGKKIKIDAQKMKDESRRMWKMN